MELLLLSVSCDAALMPLWWAPPHTRTPAAAALQLTLALCIRWRFGCAWVLLEHCRHISSTEPFSPSLSIRRRHFFCTWLIDSHATHCTERWRLCTTNQTSRLLFFLLRTAGKTTWTFTSASRSREPATPRANSSWRRTCRSALTCGLKSGTSSWTKAPLSTRITSASKWASLAWMKFCAPV